MIEKIESLRRDNTPNGIESLLLTGKLGEIRTDTYGYLRITDIKINWLVVEVHKPGFIEWMWKHPNKYVVHHIDGDKLNNVYSNLQVMSRSDHTKLHRTDPRFAETEEARCRKLSKSATAYNSDPNNVEDINARAIAMSETKRKKWSDLSKFTKFFTVGEYAEVGGISADRAQHRLMALFREGQVIREKVLSDGKWYNVYRRTE